MQFIADHLVELLLFFTNLAVVLSNIILSIITGIDNNAMAKIAMMAVNRLTNGKKLKEIAYSGKHELEIIDNSTSNGKLNA